MIRSDRKLSPALGILLAISCCQAADRTTLLIPQAADASPVIPAGARLPAAAFGAEASPGWRAYQRLWEAHYADPADRPIRRLLGLSLSGGEEVRQRGGRSAPSWLAWPRGSYTQIETPHFVIYSRAEAAAGHQVATDLERCYWAWTQMFFPFWESRPQFEAAFAGWSPDESISQFLAHRSLRLPAGDKLRVVLFRDAAEYQRAVDVPGAEQSTGFYSDGRQTTFLYPQQPDDPATRRHELVHQLFREATSSRLGPALPGEASGFWLVEGIAGYFESLHFDSGCAVVGGWDAPRLQFARFRFFVAGDRLPLVELARDGRLAAQSRSDLARWYAHAIVHTHWLLDGGDPQTRRWVYRRLAELYRIDPQSVPVGGPPPADEAVLPFLSVSDEHLRDNPITRELTDLCLAGCQVTAAGVNRIPASRQLRRLVLTGQPLDVAAVQRLVAEPSSLQQLSLEGTAIDNGIADLLRRADQLRELDLSNTPIDDAIVAAIAGAHQLTTLWLTGTRVSDQAVATIARLPALRRVDLQQTAVTERGLARLQELRPDLDINPLIAGGS